MVEEEILFVCVENGGRSQMARAFAEKYGMKAVSAGTHPSSRITPLVLEAMTEKDIDLSRNVPRALTSEMVNRATLVVTMGCSVAEVCPRPMLAQIQKKLIDWSITDPKGKSLAVVRGIRDEIEEKVLELAKQRQAAV
jgi:arsenate reductase (thioredoxin)